MTTGLDDEPTRAAASPPGPAKAGRGTVHVRPPTASPQAEPLHPRPRSLDWRRSYQRRLWVTDAVVLVVIVSGTQLAWFGTGNPQIAMSQDSRITPISYWVFSAVLVLGWLLMLAWNDSRNSRVIGAGNTEYVRVIDGSLRIFGAAAVLAFLTRTDIARGFLLISIPVGIAALLLARLIWRRWLVRRRARGDYSARVLLVGSSDSATAIGREIAGAAASGYLVVGACTPGDGEGILGDGIPVLGSLDDVERAMAATGADTVVITSTDDLPPLKVKQISWRLRAGEQHLVLAPNLLDVAGPRLHTRPIAGLPLIHVETPQFTKGQAFAKRAFDVVAASVGIVLLSPLLAGLAIAVRLSDPGPVLFRQTRVGHEGREFEMLKFRSMVDGAEDLLPALLDGERDAGNEVLFKLRNDPRITPLGRIMRRYSLDELPQLFNVLGGSMSLVGPRPSLPSEVEHYADYVHRRFLVKPGITGLWQVSGRSNLSWEQSVRLDLSYVENWTLVADLVILLKTARAVVRPGDTAV